MPKAVTCGGMSTFQKLNPATSAVSEVRKKRCSKFWHCCRVLTVSRPQSLTLIPNERRQVPTYLMASSVFDISILQSSAHARMCAWDQELSDKSLATKWLHTVEGSSCVWAKICVEARYNGGKSKQPLPVHVPPVPPVLRGRYLRHNLFCFDL